MLITEADPRGVYFLLQSFSLVKRPCEVQFFLDFLSKHVRIARFYSLARNAEIMYMKTKIHRIGSHSNTDAFDENRLEGTA